MSERFDAIVIGAGPAGEVAASRLNAQGLATALVERELIGGECGYWACIPSKTLLRPAEVSGEARRTAGTSAPEQRWAEIAAYRDYMIRHLDDSAQVEGYERDGVRVFKGEGRLQGPGRVEVAGQLLESDRVLIATGSDPSIPEVPGLREAGFWTNREATTIKEVPDSVVILGGGPVGVELGQFMRRFGSEVTVVQAPARLLAREELRADGVTVYEGVSATRVSAAPGGRRTVVLSNGESVTASELLVAAGRAP